MLVNFVTNQNEFMASYRYRVLSPQNGLLMDGINVRVTPHFLIDADSVVYQKHFNFTDYPDAIGARGMGKRVIFDICDDHSETIYKDHYNRMMTVAHEVTCNSEMMAKRIREVWNKTASVIPDPIIYRAIDRAPDLTKVLWFGFHGNIQPLGDVLDELPDHMHLEVCTGPIKGFPVKSNVQLTHFSPEEQEMAFQRNGIAWLPYDPDRSETKSANRIIEALNASMVVVTNGIPSSKELKPFVECKLSDVSDKSIIKMEAGRQFVRQRYSQKTITKAWKRALEV